MGIADRSGTESIKTRNAKQKKSLKLPKRNTEIKRTNQITIDFDTTVIQTIKERIGKQTVGNTIGWVGGKAKIGKQLAEMMPEHDMYCEVFFGSGAVFFKKPKAKHNSINDINSGLTNMYTVMRDQPDEFWKYAHYFIYSRDIFDYCLELYKDKEWNEMSDVQRAVIFYFLVRISFNNNMTHFSASQEFSMWDEYRRVISISERLQNVCIENLNYIEFINARLKDCRTYNRKALFYLDPPYIIAEKTSYYEYLFSTNDHSTLARICDQINTSGNYFMLSYEDTQIVRDLYRTYEIKGLEWAYSLGAKSDGSQKVGKEVVITNFKCLEQTNLL